MAYEHIAGPDVFDIRVPRVQAHRVRRLRNDCAPESVGADGMGLRIVFVCPDHGLQSTFDPFEGHR